MSSLRQRRGARLAPKGEKVLRPIIPNAGIEAAYRMKILKLTDEMNASVCYWLKSAYGQAEPILAQDVEFNEADHPRAPDGKFGSGGGSRKETSWPTGELSSVETTDHAEPSRQEKKIVTASIDKMLKRATELDAEGAEPATNREYGALNMILATTALDAKLSKDQRKLYQFTYANGTTGTVGAGAVKKIARDEAEIKFLGALQSGVGDKVIRSLENKAKNVLGVDKIRLTSTPEASSFYVRLGYRFDPDYDKDDFVMIKNLKEQLGQDEQPANFLQAAVRRLTRRWQRKFNQAAKDMAEHFAKAASQRSDFALQRILKESGWSVEFRMTEAQRDVINATVNQNVSLIKSIPQRYLGEVEGMVMRSVQSGRNLEQLTKDLQKSYGVTRRRAALIARDQNNKATSALQNARQRELGITEAIWVHSTAGKEPRPTHLANNGERYDVAKGWYDPAVKDWIFPGQLINCRCFSRPVIKGFS